MLTSYYDGFSRAPLRWCLAFACVLDIFIASYLCLNIPQYNPLGKELWEFWGAKELLIPLLLVSGYIGLYFAYRFVKVPGNWIAVLGMFVGLGVVQRLADMAWGGPHRMFFQTGSILLGWLVGLLLARWFHRDRAPTSPHLHEALAERLALTIVYTGYFSAGLSKVRHYGLFWSDSTSLRTIILGQNGVPPGGVIGDYYHFILASPNVSWFLAEITHVVQLLSLPAIFYAPLRLAHALLLVGFHLNTYLLTEAIVYYSAAMFALVAAIPVSRYLGWRQPLPDEEDIIPAHYRTPKAIAAASVLTVVLLLAVSLVPSRTQGMGIGWNEGHAPKRGPKTFGPFREGESLLPGVKIEELGFRETEMSMVLRSSTRQEIILTLAKTSEKFSGKPELYVQLHGKDPDQLTRDIKRAILGRLTKEALGREPVVAFQEFLDELKAQDRTH